MLPPHNHRKPAAAAAVVVLIPPYLPRTAPLITPAEWIHSQAWPEYYHTEVFYCNRSHRLPTFADGRSFAITRATVALMHLQAMHQELPLEQFRHMAFRAYSAAAVDRRLVCDLVEWAGLPHWPKFSRAVGRRVRMHSVAMQRLRDDERLAVEVLARPP